MLASSPMECTHFYKQAKTQEVGHQGYFSEIKFASYELILTGGSESWKIGGVNFGGTKEVGEICW